MKTCKECGYPIILSYCVDYKEMICFNCGKTYEFLNGCERVDETPELLEKEKQMNNIKEKVYALGFEKMSGGRNCKGITEEELNKRIKDVSKGAGEK